jgi:hypothetical protein
MTSYTLSRSLINLRQALRRYAWWLSLVLVLIVIVFAAYRAVAMPAAAVPSVSRTSQSPPVNPARQAVLDYLSAHSSEQPSPAPTATFNPAQQSVMNYVYAHKRAEQPPVFWDQAAQAVRDYLRAHSR